eukprot:m.340116 g.340116  ORF g.340116 m.340116 type:complete len:83 (-) comp19142_c0_seq1:128-376(-)
MTTAPEKLNVVANFSVGARPKRGPLFVAAGWITIIGLGASAFIMAKKDLEAKRVEEMKKEGYKPRVIKTQGGLMIDDQTSAK